jgi:hypothetical protein
MMMMGKTATGLAMMEVMVRRTYVTVLKERRKPSRAV